MSYIDEHGLVHPRKDAVSENGILFRSVYSTFIMLNGRLNSVARADVSKAIKNTTIGYGQYQANPPQGGQHFSVDNILGLYLCHILAKKSLDNIPVFWWNGEFNPHPNTWMVLLALKWPIFTYIFYIPLLFMAAHSLYFRDDTQTTGRQLWFMRLLHLKRFTWFLKLYGADRFKQDITYYWTNGGNYDNADHPIFEELDNWVGNFKEGEI